MNKQLKKNIKALDLEIEKLHAQLADADDNAEYGDIIERIEQLTDLRCKLSESKVLSSHSKEIISGLIGIAGMVLVLKHEQTEVITTKAFSMATKMFRG